MDEVAKIVLKALLEAAEEAEPGLAAKLVMDMSAGDLRQEVLARYPGSRAEGERALRDVQEWAREVGLPDLGLLNDN